LIEYALPKFGQGGAPVGGVLIPLVNTFRVKRTAFAIPSLLGGERSLAPSSAQLRMDERRSALRSLPYGNLKMRPEYRGSTVDSSENVEDRFAAVVYLEEESMKVATLAALSVLITLPAEAGQRHRQNNVSPSCDNDGPHRCVIAAA